LQSTVTSQLPGRLSAKGIQECRADTGRRRGIRCANGRFYPPKGGWSQINTYEVLLNEEEPEDVANTGDEASTVSTSIQCVLGAQTGEGDVIEGGRASLKRS